MKGMIHLYCGDGKGKTTAAMGLAVRAAGAGLQVVIVQFLKGRETGEWNSLSQIPRIRVLRNREDYGFLSGMTQEQKRQITSWHNENLKEAIQLVDRGECQLLILDEVTYPYQSDLLDKTLLEQLTGKKPDTLELVLTGRNPAEFMINCADYITEMKMIRHPFEKGIRARKGIEF